MVPRVGFIQEVVHMGGERRHDSARVGRHVIAVYWAPSGDMHPAVARARA